MRSTKGQLEEFFNESFIWKDICDELDSWIADNHIAMEDPLGELTIVNFKHHAAICHALRRVKAIGTYMLIDQDLKKENQDG